MVTKCLVPDWFETVFNWANIEKIDMYTFAEALKYLVINNLATCQEVSI